MKEADQIGIVPDEKKCAQCGALLPTGALAGLCPACLLKQGVAADTATQPATPPFEPPPVAEVARLFPQLEILALIGQGGMGAVYQARQPALDRLVALKILPAQPAVGPNFAERFNREARALARLSHPNIVGVHEFGQANGRFYFIMEFVDGANLRQLEQAARLSPREALQIIPQICDALQYAHDEGVVHRDIKPENVLVDRKGRVKIADFGLAKMLGCEAQNLRLTGEGQVMGTPHYMAPEQVERPLQVDHRADIYALGVVFYEMLTGELPLGKFPPPSGKAPVDARLDEVVLHALEKEPEQRYQHASEVKTDVERIVQTPSSAPPMSAAPLGAVQPGREAMREPRLSRLAVIGAIWAPFFLSLTLFFYAKAVPAAEYHGPAWWQLVLGVVLSAIGLTAPFGTTILGWLAVAQIRRSAGRLYGLGLALFDGLLYPLLALDGLIGWCWSFVLHRLLELNPPADGVPTVNNEALMLATILTSLAVDAAIVWWAWRMVRKPVDSRPTAVPQRPPPATTASGTNPVLGMVALMVTIAGLVAPLLVGLIFPPAWSYVAWALLGFQLLGLGLGALAWRSRAGKCAAITAGINVTIWLLFLFFINSGLAIGGTSAKQAVVVISLTTADPVISKDLTVTASNTWSASCTATQTFRLFEVSNPGVERCVVTYRLKLKTENLAGRAYLEMWCRLPGRGEFFSRSLGNVATGSNDWASYETPFFLKKGEKPDLIRLNLVVEGRGQIEIKDVQLLVAPLR